MAAASTDNFIKVGESTATTLSSPGYTIGATSINVASTTNWPTDTGVLFAIDEVDAAGARVSGTYNVFAGVVSGATQISSLSYVGGDANRNYSAGATTRVYVHVGADRIDRLVDGILTEHNQDGTHGNITATSITTSSLTLSGQSNDGWLAPGGTHSVSTGYNAGNRSFTINTSTDLSSIVSNGMRYRVTRGTTPPTQCADLEASSSHYASKSSPSGITLGTTASFEAWVNLESYTANAGIITRYAGGATVGWTFEINSDGTVQVLVGESSNTDDFSTYQSVPLNRWVHLAATVNVSTNSYAIYIDGVSVPISTASTTATGIADSGNLELGARNATTFLDGKLADVRVWSDVRTATEIQDNMYAYPSDTTGLVAHFKLNGDFTDASSNGNNLTAQNSAVATNADNPWNATEYGVITNVTSSTIQVFCPEGYGIPKETLSAPFYSTQDAPYGFPRDNGKWEVETLMNIRVTKTTPVTATTYNYGDRLTVPVGAWLLGYKVSPYLRTTTAQQIRIQTDLDPTEVTGAYPSSTGATVDSKSRWNTISGYCSSQTDLAGESKVEAPVELSAATTYNLNHYCQFTGTGNSSAFLNDLANGRIYARCAYL